MKEHLKAVFSSYAEIFFLPGAVAGGVIFAATLVHPSAALAGIVSVLAAYGFARLVGMQKQFLQSGYYTYNPLLVGLSIGNLFVLGPLTVFFLVSAGLFTFLTTVFMANVFTTWFRLPILSLPFVLVSSIAYLGSLRYSNLRIVFPQTSVLMSSTLGLPYWAAGFFKAFGAVLFAPSVVVGLILSGVVLRYSRILFGLAVAGYYTGAVIRMLMLGSASQAFADVNNFNFIFIAMALGGVFLIPSLTSYLLALIGVAVSTLLMDAITGFWSYYGIPAFTLPFNLVTLSFVYVLGLLRHPLVASNVGRTPEEALENHLANRLRYRGKDFTLYLPFAGRWTVWQGWDGQWTHKGSWRYAYDFVLTDSTGETHAGEGGRLEDYFCYRKPVLSPVRGRVARVVDDLPDSPIGAVDAANNWGNLIIIQDPRGLYVEISHFADKSIRVKQGDWVERGAVLGLCGNSGYSPQPHIHVQAQATDEVGAASLPFSFVSYLQDGEFQANQLPPEKAIIEPLYSDKRLERLTSFVLDEELRFEVLRDGRSIDKLVVKVVMAPDGTFFLESRRGRLYFGRHEGTFYTYSLAGNDRWLALLFLALPRMPLACRDGMRWQDHLPIGVVTTGARRMAVGFLSSFYPRLATVTATLRFVSDTRIETTIEAGLLHLRREASVELDAQKGFATVTVNDITLRRLAHE